MTAAAPDNSITEEVAPALPKSAIEAVAQALYALSPWRKRTHSEDAFAWDELTDGERESFREEAAVVLAGAAPIIATQAKGGALREAADELWNLSPKLKCNYVEWLRARARSASTESESSNV